MHPHTHTHARARTHTHTHTHTHTYIHTHTHTHAIREEGQRMLIPKRDLQCMPSTRYDTTIVMAQPTHTDTYV